MAEAEVNVTGEQGIVSMSKKTFMACRWWSFGGISVILIISQDDTRSSGQDWARVRARYIGVGRRVAGVAMPRGWLPLHNVMYDDCNMNTLTIVL